MKLQGSLTTAALIGLAPAGGRQMPPIPIGHVAIEPWRAWPPPGSQQQQQVSTHGGTTYAVDSAGATIALLLDSAIDAPVVVDDVHLLFSTAIVPGQPSAGLPSGILVGPNVPADPAFVAKGESNYAIGHVLLGWGGFTSLRIEELTSAPTAAAMHVQVACAFGPLVADAVGSGDGYIVAASSGSPFGDCSQSGDLPQAPNEIQISMLDAGTLSFADSLTAEDPVLRVSLVPRSGGAWLVWQADGASSGATHPVMAAVVDGLGGIGEPFVVASTIASYGAFSADALGDRLVVAWADSSDPSALLLRVQLFEPTRRPGPSASLASTADPSSNVEIAVAGSPSSDAVLLAWTGTATPSRLHLARFDCSP